MKVLLRIVLLFVLTKTSAQIIDTCCINPAWIDPNTLCGMIWDPVIGCDGIQYSNDCVAAASGVSYWVDQAGSETALNWDCGDSPVALCTSSSGIDIFLPDLWVNPNDPCEMGECTSDGEFIQIVVDCMEDTGMPCNGEWVSIEGQCCSECIATDDSYCDSINLNPILPLNGVLNDSVLQVNIETYFTNYSIPYAGLMLIDYLGDTIATETLYSAGNVYTIGPNMTETRDLVIVNELVFPFTGELCVVEDLFAGLPNIVCSYPVSWQYMALDYTENEAQPKLLRMIDVLGRVQTIHHSGQLLFYIYDNGLCEKRIKD